MMAVFALILNGQVLQIEPETFPVNEALTWVDCSAFPGVTFGWTATESNGVWSFIAPQAPPPPTLAQQAKAMLGAGIHIVSTATPALNGTYPCDQDTGNQDGNTLAAINAGLTFPGGVIIRLDAAGTAHVFSVADFKNLCQAKLNYQQALNTIIGSNAGTLPEQPTTIA